MSSLDKKEIRRRVKTFRNALDEKELRDMSDILIQIILTSFDFDVLSKRARLFISSDTLFFLCSSIIFRNNSSAYRKLLATPLTAATELKFTTLFWDSRLMTACNARSRASLLRSLLLL